MNDWLTRAEDAGANKLLGHHYCAGGLTMDAAMAACCRDASGRGCAATTAQGSLSDLGRIVRVEIATVGGRTRRRAMVDEAVAPANCGWGGGGGADEECRPPGGRDWTSRVRPGKRTVALGDGEPT